VEPELLTEKLVAWIRERVTAAGCRGVVLGLSGGLDSSVLAALCRRAMPQDTLGLIMPCHSRDEDEAHALEVAGKFAIPATKITLDAPFDALLQTLPGYQVDNETGQLARANLKTRLRMLTLYYVANQLKYLVAGSSNRSEISIGYFTKYGDGGVDVMPLGSLVKAQVRELARFLGIPGAIIDKPPSAGLWAGQTDEDEIGLSYEALDRYLIDGCATDEVRSRIEDMIAASRHKHIMPPIPEL
jgi:NAD+ synthase